MIRDLEKFFSDDTCRLWITLSDTGGRRSGLDRRVLAGSNHIPERRSVNDRRGKPDRRQGIDGVAPGGNIGSRRFNSPPLSTIKGFTPLIPVILCIYLGPLISLC